METIGCDNFSIGDGNIQRIDCNEVEKGCANAGAGDGNIQNIDCNSVGHGDVASQSVVCANFGILTVFRTLSVLTLAESVLISDLVRKILRIQIVEILNSHAEIVHLVMGIQSQ